MIAPSSDDDYSGLSKQARYERRESEKRADIGTIPAVVNPERRALAENDLLFFLVTYFPQSTGLSPLSEDHKRVIARMQNCILRGGRFCNAVYRGFAKTTITCNAAIWAAVFGHRRYMAIFSASDPQAAELLASIKSELEENELLQADFPEVCHAIGALEGKPQRCKSQAYKGKLTHIVWKADKIVIPAIEGSNAGGAIIISRSMSGSATRGLVHKTPEGVNQRPDMVIVDDPQTTESAGTAEQVRKRLDILKRSILKSGGHNKQIACVVNATVICFDDMVEQLLDRKRNPAWEGERIKMVRKWADAHESFWLEQYAKIRNDFDETIPGDHERAKKAANELYAQNREHADAGCEVSWDECYDREWELSAIQHAYNFLIDDGADVFATECQNEPRKDDVAKSAQLIAKEIQACLNGFDRYQFPRECEYVTAFIDVHQTLLYYVVTAWASDFTGFVIDYGTWPKQPTNSFTLANAPNTFERAFPGMPLESQIFEALSKLVTEIGDCHWIRADGAKIPVGQIVIDANWGQSTKTVKRVCQVHKHSNILLPWHGKGIRASAAPMMNWPKVDGERRGQGWLLRPDKEATKLRHIIGDTYFWKSFVAARFSVKAPAKQSLSLWGNDPRKHELFANHCAAEYSARVTAESGRVVDEWMTKPNHDNHLWDCLVGSAVAASICGASLEAQSVVKKQRRVVSIPKHLLR